MNVRLTLVLLIALLVVGGYAIFVGAQPEQAPRDRGTYLYNVDIGAITGVHVSHNGHTQDFVWDSAQRRWVFDDQQREPVDLDRWSGIPVLLQGPLVSRELLPRVDNPALYGLDDPSVIAVTLRDGRVIELLLGDLTADEQHHYVMRRGAPELVLVHRSWADVLLRLATDPPYLPTPTPAPTATPTPTAAPSPEPTPAQE